MSISRPSHLRRLAVIAAVLATSIGAALATAVAGSGTASASATTRPAMIVRDNANGKTITVRVGEQVDLILASNYWHISGSSSSRVLHQNGPAYLLPRPGSCAPIPGIGCTPIEVNFTARGAGKAVVTASRFSCGEALACMPSMRNFKVTIIVKH
jgi:hypothetical protein